MSSSQGRKGGTGGKEDGSPGKKAMNRIKEIVKGSPGKKKELSRQSGGDEDDGATSSSYSKGESQPQQGLGGKKKSLKDLAAQAKASITKAGIGIGESGAPPVPPPALGQSLSLAQREQQGGHPRMTIPSMEDQLAAQQAGQVRSLSRTGHPRDTRSYNSPAPYNQPGQVQRTRTGTGLSQEILRENIQTTTFDQKPIGTTNPWMDPKFNPKKASDKKARPLKGSSDHLPPTPPQRTGSGLGQGTPYYTPAGAAYEELAEYPFLKSKASQYSTHTQFEEEETSEPAARQYNPSSPPSKRGSQSSNMARVGSPTTSSTDSIHQPLHLIGAPRGTPLEPPNSYFTQDEVLTLKALRLQLSRTFLINDLIGELQREDCVPTSAALPETVNAEMSELLSQAKEKPRALRNKLKAHPTALKYDDVARQNKRPSLVDKAEGDAQAVQQATAYLAETVGRWTIGM